MLTIRCGYRDHEILVLMGACLLGIIRDHPSKPLMRVFDSTGNRIGIVRGTNLDDGVALLRESIEGAQYDAWLRDHAEKF